jgi:hypothetical protein
VDDDENIALEREKRDQAIQVIMNALDRLSFVGKLSASGDRLTFTLPFENIVHEVTVSCISVRKEDL